MFKLLLIPTCLLYVILTSAQAPNIRVLYETDAIYFESAWANLDKDKRNIVKSVLLNKKIHKRYEWVRLGDVSKFEMLSTELQPEIPTGAYITGGVDGAYTYIDYSKNTIRKIRKFGNVLCLEASLPKYSWQLEDTSKIILGYDCHAAYMIQPEFLRGTDTVRVWFAPEIPVDGGPDMVYGLPGLILESNLINKNSVQINRAYSIELNKVTPEAVRPKDIKYKRKISWEEYCDKIK